MQAPATRSPTSPGPQLPPLMQAPATPLSVRHGPFGQDLQYGPPRGPGYGVIHELRGPVAPNLGSFSTVRPRRRLRGPSAGPAELAGGLRSALEGPDRGRGDARPAARHGRVSARGPVGRDRGRGTQRNARRNRRPTVESADVATCDLKTSVPWPLRARPTIRRPVRGPLPGYPRRSTPRGRFRAGYPPAAHHLVTEGRRRDSRIHDGVRTLVPDAPVFLTRRSLHPVRRSRRSLLARSRRPAPSRVRRPGPLPRRGRRWRSIAGAGHNETPEGTNRSAGPSPPDASTCDSVSDEPRSAASTADASTCDAALGPSWPLRARPTVRPAPRSWLWGYPRTSRAGRAESRVVLHGPSTAPAPRSSGGSGRARRGALGQRSRGQTADSDRTGRPSGPTLNGSWARDGGSAGHRSHRRSRGPTTRLRAG